jgi:hypothetical protein
MRRELVGLRFGFASVRRRRGRAIMVGLRQEGSREVERWMLVPELKFGLRSNFNHSPHPHPHPLSSPPYRSSQRRRRLRRWSAEGTHAHTSPGSPLSPRSVRNCQPSFPSRRAFPRD